MSSPDSALQRGQPEVITEVSVSEISVERTGSMPPQRENKAGSTVSRFALGLGILSILFAPLFGVGVVPAIVGIIVGHIAKEESQSAGFEQ